MDTPLKVFLLTLSDDDNAVARRAVAVGVESFAGPASLHFDLSQALLIAGLSASAPRQQAAVATVFHLFWRLIPLRIFDPVEPHYRRLAEDVLRSSLQAEPSPDETRALTVVYKRLRQQHFERRSATSLDLANPRHEELLTTQGGRCAACGYPFTAGDIDLYFEDDRVLTAPHEPVLPGELVLETIMRSPVLDHILPVFLGGDSPANWQILCRSCNAGKGETWSSIVRAASPPRQVAEVLRLRPMLRYLVFAEHVRVNGAPCRELHILKRDPRGLVTLHNLIAVPGPEYPADGTAST